MSSLLLTYERMNRFRVLGIVGDDEGSRNNGQWLLSKWSSEETQLVEEAPQSL